MMMAVIAPISLKPARQDPMARIHRRSSAWSVQSDIQARKQRPSVNLGKIFLTFSLFSSFHFPHSSYVLRCAFIYSLSLLSSFLHLPTTSATKESSIPTPASLVQNAPQDSSKIKTPSQVLRAKHVQQVTTAPSQVPRRAPILVASNPKTARTTSILT